MLAASDVRSAEGLPTAAAASRRSRPEGHIIRQVMLLNGVEFDQRRIAALCRRAGVVRLYVFGSILTDQFRPDSDIDLLVETDPAHPTGLLALGGLQMDLTELLGRPVHLTLLGGVPTSERASVLAHARALDAA